MKFNGLSQNEVEESRKKNGSNTLTQIPPDPLWKKILEGFKDPMIMILLVALVVQVELSVEDLELLDQLAFQELTQKEIVTVKTEGGWTHMGQ